LAIGDISSRTAVVTDEISKFSDQMLKADVENKDLVAELDARLKGALDNLNSELGGLDSQISSHQSTIKSLKTDLNVSHGLLNDRISEVEQNLQSRLTEIATEQDKQHRTQQMFADELDDLEKKGSITADELYANKIESAEQQRLINKKFIVGSSTIAALFVITLAIISYLHWGTGDFGPETVSREINTKLNSLATNLTGSFASKAEINTQTASIDAKVSDLQQQLAQNATELSRQDQAAAETLKGLAEKIAALQLSVYGPEDTAVSLATPAIPVKDQGWIAQQDPQHYSIQLVGVYRERSLINFVNRHGEHLTDHPMAFNISEYRGQDWYNLVYGSFASFSEAQQVLESLPDSIQRNAPWVRQMGSIQRTGVN
jgi:septal ring-binding cell division protein DamX